MGILVKNDIDPALGAMISFLTTQHANIAQQQAAQAAEAERQRQLQDAARQAAAQQALAAAAQAANAGNQGAPQQGGQQQQVVAGAGGGAGGRGGSGGAGGGTSGGGGGGAGGSASHDDTARYIADREARAKMSAAAMGFLGQQSHAAGVASAAGSNADARLYGQQAISQRAALNNAAQLQRAQITAANQQQLAEINKNLQQRNKLMQTAPGIIDPQQTVDAQSRIQANQDALSYPARQARQKLMERIAIGDPEAIQEGLSQGVLAFSPEQQTRIKQLREAMSQVDIDPSLSPAQRALAERNLSEKLNGIRPMEVPGNEQPVDPIEQYHRGTITFPHPTLGIPITKQKVVRNGEEQWVLTDESKADVEAEHKRREKQWEHDTGMSRDYIKEAQQMAAIEALTAHMPNIKEFTKPPKEEGGQPNVDYDGFRKAMDEWRGKMDTLSNAFYADSGGANHPALDDMNPDGSTPDMPQDQGPVQSQPQAGGELDEFSPDETQPQQQAAPPVSPHPLDGPNQWNSTPIGAVVTLPDGRPVRKTGPKSYEPVQ
jgi:hypothetical protein